MSCSNTNLDLMIMMNLSTSSIFEQPEHNRAHPATDNQRVGSQATVCDYSKILTILENAEHAIHMDQAAFPFDPFLLEPTPLGPQGVHGVRITPQDGSSTSFSEDFGHRVNDLTSLPKLSNGIGIPTSRPSKKQRLVEDGAPDTTGSSRHGVVSGRNHEEQTQESPSALSPIPMPNRMARYQSDQWKERFQDLVHFKHENGHCLVPHNFPPNQKLAQWTKRQRYQYRLKSMGRHSTLTDQREKALQEMDFIWDSHGATWQERFESLKVFRIGHEHTNVPSSYEGDKTLAIWVKCQRRQMRLRRKGAKSTLTQERIEAMESLGFDWNPRNL